MVKINLPSNFIPELDSDKQEELKQEIADRALDINFYKTTIDRTGHYDEWRRATNNICEAFAVIQDKAGALCLTTDEQNTATLTSHIYSEFALLDDVRKYLDASDKNYELIRRIVNYASSLLFEFKEYEYNLFNDYMSQLKQSIA